MESLQVSLHDRPVVMELTLVLTAEWFLLLVRQMASEGVILLHYTADKNDYEALKELYGKAFRAVKKPSKVSSWNSWWRLARRKVQRRPYDDEQPTPIVILVDISLPWQESTDKVTCEQGEEWWN